jgi:putative flippase GtrA
MSNRKPMVKHALRYLIGGATTTVLTWSCVWAFVELAGFHYLVSTNLATLTAYFYSYAVNKLFVFEDKQAGHLVKGSQFLALQLCLVALTNVFMFVTVSIAGINYMVSVVVISVINAAISFIVMRSAIFR